MRNMNGEFAYGSHLGQWTRFIAVRVLGATALTLCFSCSSRSSPPTDSGGGAKIAPIREIRLPGPLKDLSTNGNSLVGTVGDDVYAWDWRSLDAPPKELGSAAGFDAAWSDPRTMIEAVSGASDPQKVHPLRLKDPRTGKTHELCQLGREWYVTGVKATRNNKHIAVRLAYDSVAGDPTWYAFNRHTYALGVVDVAKREVAWLRPIHHPDREGSLSYDYVAVSDDGTYVAAFGCDGSGAWIHVANPRIGRSLWECVPDGSVNCSAVSFSSDGKVVFAADSVERLLYAFETATGRILGRMAMAEGKDLGSGRYVAKLVATPDGRYVAAALRPAIELELPFGLRLEGEVLVWDVGAGKVVRTLRTRRGMVSRLAFSPDSKLLATHSDRDDTIEIWRVPCDAASSEAEVQVFDAVKAGKLADLQTVLGKDPDSCDAQDGYHRTPLHWAVIAGREECAQALLEAGAVPINSGTPVLDGQPLDQIL